MKKLGLLGIGTMMLLAACKKSDMQYSKQGKNLMAMSSELPAVLSIDSFTDYQSIIGQAEGTAIENTPNGFISLKTELDQLDSLKYQDSVAYYSSPNIGDTIYEDYGRLLDVLNQDKIVKLNGNYVKVDLAKDSVYVISDTVNNAYGIITGNKPSPALLSFSSAINVNVHIWVNIKIPPIGGCNESAAGRDKAKMYRYASSKYRTKEKLVYQTAGIYFSVVAKAKNQHKAAWVWWSWAGGQPELYMTLTWKVKCGATQSYWEGYASSWSGPWFDANANIATFRPYSSTAPLTSYDVSCSYHTPCGTGDFLHIHS